MTQCHTFPCSCTCQTCLLWQSRARQCTLVSMVLSAEPCSPGWSGLVWLSFSNAGMTQCRTFPCKCTCQKFLSWQTHACLGSLVSMVVRAAPCSLGWSGLVCRHCRRRHRRRRRHCRHHRPRPCRPRRRRHVAVVLGGLWSVVRRPVSCVVVVCCPLPSPSLSLSVVCRPSSSAPPLPPPPLPPPPSPPYIIDHTSYIEYRVFHIIYDISFCIYHIKIKHHTLYAIYHIIHCMSCVICHQRSYIMCHV